MKHLLPRLLLLFWVSSSFTGLSSQTIFWSDSSPGELNKIKSLDLSTMEETVVYESSALFRIETLTLDKKEQRVIFTEYNFVGFPAPESRLAMIDYSGDNYTVLESSLLSISLQYDTITENIYFITRSGDDLFEIKKRDNTGVISTITTCTSCRHLTFDEDDQMLLFSSGDEIKRISVNGGTIENLDFFPPLEAFGTRQYSFNKASNEFYISDVRLSTELTRRVSPDGLFVDTIPLYGVVDPENDSAFSYDYMFPDPVNDRLYYLWAQTDISGEAAYLTTLRFSNLDGENIQVVPASFPDWTGGFDISAWAVDEGDPIAVQADYIVEHRIITPPDNIPPLLGTYNSSSQTPVPFKICTDGSPASTFELRLTTQAEIEGDYYLRIHEDPNTQLPEIFGSVALLPEQSFSNLLVFEYTHPTYMASTVIGPEYSIDIVRSSDDAIVAEVPIQFYTPPVLLIHGLGANRSSFAGISQFLGTTISVPTELIRAVDYSRTNDVYFADNSVVVPGNTSSAIEKALLAGYATSQVDIIAHSMGGILSRLYIESINYKGDVNKLITINTPHAGSQAANRLLEDGFNSADIICGALFTLNIFGNVLFECNNGAVADLRVDSDAVRIDLNTQEPFTPSVPSHTITSTSDLLDPMTLALRILLTISLDEMFNNEQSDGIVALSSQEGGLNMPQSSHFDDLFHTAVLSDPNVMLSVQELLFAEPSSSFFAQDGFSPPVLDYLNDSPNNEPNFQPVVISSSFENQSVSYGTEIDIQISSAMEQSILLINSTSLLSGAQLETLPSGNISIDQVISPNQLGEIPLTVFAFSETDNALGIDTMYVNVTTDNAPVHFSETSGAFYLNQPQAASITADFGDFWANIAAAPGITYSFVNGLAEYAGNGLISPLTPGRDYYTVTFNGITSPEFPIDILDPAIINKVENLPNKHQRGTLEIDIYPNPGTDQIYLSTKRDLPDAYQLRISDATGKIWYQERDVLINQLTPMPLQIDRIPAGIYFLEIWNTENHGVTKFIKQ